MSNPGVPLEACLSLLGPVPEGACGAVDTPCQLSPLSSHWSATHVSCGATCCCCWWCCCLVTTALNLLWLWLVARLARPAPQLLQELHPSGTHTGQQLE